MNTVSLLTTEQVAQAAFGLLSSSGIARYTRMASRSAIDTGLVDKLYSGEAHEYEATLSLRACELLGAMIRSDERGEYEAEAAVIIAALIIADTESGNSLSGLLSAVKTTSLRWIAAMVRELAVQQRAARDATLSQQHGEIPEAYCDSGTPTNAWDNTPYRLAA